MSEMERAVNIQDYRVAGQPFLLEGNEIGILLSHGYTGTTSSMRYLGDHLNKIEGWTVLAPRLKGHGESPAAMAGTTAADWIRSLEDGLATLAQRCDTIFMAGLSMGGCLTLYMAAQYPDKIRAAVPINAPLYLGTPDLAALAYDRNAPEFTVSINDIKDAAVAEVAYSEVPVSTIKELYGLMNITRDLLNRVVCPTLVMVSPDDHVVSPSNAKAILDGISSKDRRQFILHNSYHAATIDFDKDIIVEQTRRFFKEHLPDAQCP